MDVESKATLDEAVDRAHGSADEAIDRTATALRQLLVEAVKSLAGIVQTANDSVRAALATATVDVQSTLNSLDGWHVTLKPSGPILALTGEIEVTLSKPKEKV